MLVILILTGAAFTFASIEVVPSYSSDAWEKFYKDWLNSPEYKQQYEILKKKTYQPDIRWAFQKCASGKGFDVCDTTKCIVLSKEDYSVEWLKFAKINEEHVCDNQSLRQDLRLRIKAVEERRTECLTLSAERLKYRRDCANIK